MASIRDHLLIVSLNKGHRGVSHMQTNTGKGGRGFSKMLTTADGGVLSLKIRKMQLKLS